MGLLNQAQTQDPNAVTNPAGVNTPKINTDISAPSVISNQSTVQASSYTADLDPRAQSANQLKEMTAKDGPLMQRAKAMGTQAAAKRGFTGGSSIAAGAAMGEVVDRITPYALQDAESFRNRQSENLDAQNKTSMFNAEQDNLRSRQADTLVQDIARLEKEGTIKSGAEAQKLKDELTLLESKAGYEMSDLERRSELERLADQVSSAQKYEQDRVLQQEEIAFRSEADAKLFQRQEAERRNSFVIEQQWNTKGKQEDAAIEAARLDRDVGREAALTQIKLQADTFLEQVRSANQDLINRNSTAGEMYNTYQRSIAEIYANPNITPEQAAQASVRAQEAFQGSMDLISAMGGAGAVTVGNTPVTPNIGVPSVMDRQNVMSQIKALTQGITAENEAGLATQIDALGRQAGMTAEEIDAAAGLDRGTTARYRASRGWAA